MAIRRRRASSVTAVSAASQPDSSRDRAPSPTQSVTTSILAAPPWSAPRRDQHACRPLLDQGELDAAFQQPGPAASRVGRPPPSTSARFIDGDVGVRSIWPYSTRASSAEVQNIGRQSRSSTVNRPASGPRLSISSWVDRGGGRAPVAVTQNNGTSRTSPRHSSRPRVPPPEGGEQQGGSSGGELAERDRSCSRGRCRRAGVDPEPAHRRAHEITEPVRPDLGHTALAAPAGRRPRPHWSPCHRGTWRRSSPRPAEHPIARDTGRPRPARR